MSDTIDCPFCRKPIGFHYTPGGSIIVDTHSYSAETFARDSLGKALLVRLEVRCVGSDVIAQVIA